MRQLLAIIARLGPWAYGLEALLVFSEDALFFGFVFPAETVLAFCAFLAQQHVLDVWAVGAIAIVFAIAGDQAGYEIGRRFGPALRASRLGRRIGEKRWTAAERLLEERGGPAVFLGRWIAFLRALVPTTSGMLRMRWRTFALYNALGGLTWAIAWTAIGFLAGASWETVAKRFGEVTAGVALLLALAAWVAFGLLRRRKASREAGRATG